MRIHCNHCDADFDADNTKAACVESVICQCGAKLVLRYYKAGDTRLGRYRLVNQIAVGGMGEVWFAILEGAYGFIKEVAIKRLLPRFNDDLDNLDRLVREARISALLQHPNIAEVYDLAHADGHYFIVMEYVPGIALSDILAAAKHTAMQLPWELGVVLTVQLLRGLQYAHQMPHGAERESFIHRDVSPQNLLVMCDARAKIIDFGIAKTLHEAPTTGPNMIRGKINYQAPERLLHQPVDTHADLFAAAAMLYECWSTRLLFDAPTLQEVLRKIAITHVPAMSEWRGDINLALEKVVRRALLRAQEHRYQHAAQFEQALLQACGNDTFEALQGRAASFLQQHAALFFAPLQRHKIKPGLLEEETLKILRDAGPTPRVTEVLADTRPTTKINIGEKPAGRRWSLGHHKMLPAGLVALVLIQATALYFINSSPPQHAGAADTGSMPTVSAPHSSFAEQPSPLMLTSPFSTFEVQAHSPSPSAAQEDDTKDALDATLRPTSGTLPTSTLAASPDAPPEPPEVNHFFRRHRHTLMSCFDDATVALDEDLLITIAADGSVTVALSQDQLGAHAACFQSRAKQLRFRAFRGEAVTYILPLHVTSKTSPRQ